MKLSVVIVSYCNTAILKDCLDSIETYNDIGDRLEVIVSDNSPDNSVYDYLCAEYPWVRVVKNENIGFGGGNNRGVALATGEYLLFLNPDTVLIEPIFSYILDAFERDGDLALCGIKLLKPDRTRNKSFFWIDKWGFSCLSIGCYERRDRYLDGQMFISGADLFVRRSAFEEAGAFDENIFMYNEESDLIKRIKQRATAKKTAYFPEKSMIHLQGGTEEGGADQLVRSMARQLLTDEYYAKKWGMDLKKMLAARLRYDSFKRVWFTLTFRREKAKTCKRLIALYKEKLKSQ